MFSIGDKVMATKDVTERDLFGHDPNLPDADKNVWIRAGECGKVSHLFARVENLVEVTWDDSGNELVVHTGEVMAR